MSAPAIRSLLPLLCVGMILLGLSTFSSAADRVSLRGSGASFPAPLYLRWFKDFYRANPHAQVDYQVIGSGAGVANFLEERLDFAGSDWPLTAEDIEQVEGGLVQAPIVAGSIAVIYNLEGKPALRLSRDALARIFLGEITRWNDPTLTALNPDAKLPDEPITVVARADSSGTALHMTRHLSAISPAFAEKVGVSKTPAWPETLAKSAHLVKGRGNGGVSAFVQAIPSSIGFVEQSYAVMTSLPSAALENKSGNYVAPSLENLQAALGPLHLMSDRDQLADPTDPQAYPIVALSWIILHREYPEKKQAVLQDLLRYCLTDGKEAAAQLGYIPLPPHMVKAVMEYLDEIQAKG